ncbi:DUF4442 domain-containing protein [Leptospira wolffii]|uniref:DUF4442 domain-containing protein n=1 Tax=Leptospira wolffii TaxID=409998 RepID=UPI0002FF2263|nr:DUF4442 domain-containing protein [Leptospira wolffii]EPG66908.1 putative thioesterase [Leptospira wolffii serovar Khorat str. Khorat-H2]
MNGIRYDINPLWKFLLDRFGLGDAFNFFSPFAGAGIKVKVKDRHTIESSMDLSLTNTNYVEGAHFGGSLYSMCDPFYMFLLMDHLGPDYIVWDKSAQIEFLRPGRGTVRAVFHIPSEELDRIRKTVADTRKMNWTASCEILDEDGKQVARIQKILYVRSKIRTKHTDEAA